VKAISVMTACKPLALWSSARSVQVPCEFSPRNASLRKVKVRVSEPPKKVSAPSGSPLAWYPGRSKMVLSVPDGLTRTRLKSPGWWSTPPNGSMVSVISADSVRTEPP